jgi:hypothetical protein
MIIPKMLVFQRNIKMLGNNSRDFVIRIIKIFMELILHNKTSIKEFY